MVQELFDLKHVRRIRNELASRRPNESQERYCNDNRNRGFSDSLFCTYIRINEDRIMVIKLNWTNESPEYREALNEYVEHIFLHIKDKGYALDQVNSLAMAAAAESTSMLLNPSGYLKRATEVMKTGVLTIEGNQLTNEEEASIFVGIQVERFRWILEDAISRDYNIAIELLRKQRLDS